MLLTYKRPFASVVGFMFGKDATTLCLQCSSLQSIKPSMQLSELHGELAWQCEICQLPCQCANNLHDGTADRVEPEPEPEPFDDSDSSVRIVRRF